MAIENSKILGVILELTAINRSANSAYSPHKWVKWAELTVLFSWQLQNVSYYFDFSIAMGANYSFELISIEY